MRNQTIYTIPISSQKYLAIDLLPEDIQSEIGLIGSVLDDPDGLYKARRVLTADDFISHLGRNIFKAICSFDDKGKPFNISDIDDSFSHLENTKYYKYSDTMFDARDTHTGTLIVHYSRAVKKKSLQRKGISFAENISRQCYQTQTDLLAIAHLTADYSAELFACREIYI